MGMSMSHVLLFAIGGEIDVDGPTSWLLRPGANNREVVDVGSVFVRNRMCCLGCDLLELAVALRLVNTKLPSLTTDGAGATHGLV